MVKSRLDYDDLNKDPTEFRAEMELEAYGSGVFASLVDSNRFWDPTFSKYKCCGFMDDESEEIVECKFRFAKDQPVYLKR